MQIRASGGSYKVHWPDPFPKSSISKNGQSRQLYPNSTIQTFPNPTTDYLIVQWDWFKEGITDNIEFYLTDLSGKVIYSKVLKDFRANSEILHLESIPSGSYSFNVKSDGLSLFGQKIVILKD